MSSIRGIRNNNPFNIRKGNTWLGERPNQKDPAFEEFESIEYGIRAGLKLMRNHISGFNGSRPKCQTLYKLIYRWAPPVENDTEAYLKTVCKLTGYSPFQLLRQEDGKTLRAIGWAMVQVECGVELPIEKFETAWAML